MSVCPFPTQIVNMNNAKLCTLLLEVMKDLLVPYPLVGRDFLFTTSTSICLSVYLTNHPSIYVYIYLSADFIYLSVHLSVSVCLESIDPVISRKVQEVM